jgi:hypothetical protein
MHASIAQAHAYGVASGHGERSDWAGKRSYVGPGSSRELRLRSVFAAGLHAYTRWTILTGQQTSSPWA